MSGVRAQTSCIYIRILWLGIMYYVRDGPQTVVRVGTSRGRSMRLPPDGWRPLAVTGGIIQSDVYP